MEKLKLHGQDYNQLLKIDSTDKLHPQKLHLIKKINEFNSIAQNKQKIISKINNYPFPNNYNQNVGKHLIEGSDFLKNQASNYRGESILDRDLKQNNHYLQNIQNQVN